MELNDFTFSGMILILLGAALAYVRAVPRALWQFIKTRFTIVIDVTERDVFYDWVANWLAEQEHFKKCRRLSVSAQRKREDDVAELTSDSGRKAWQIKVVPAQGEHFFMWRGCRVWMHKDREKLKETGVFLGFFESVQFTFLTRNRTLVESFLDEVRQFNVSDDDARLAIYTNQYSSWRLFSLVHPRSPNTVVLSDDKMQSLIKDIEQFFASKLWYREHAIPYRRGYLLHGPPGNGKSSSVRALASHFGRDVYILRAGKDLDDANFMELLIDLPENAFLLIEDVDKISDDRNENRLTRSGFLNALDGIAATTGRVVFMTTNFVDELDEALMRPGRADVVWFIDTPTRQQAEIYLNRFLDTANTERVISAMSDLNGRMSMAALQAEIIRRCTPGAQGVKINEQAQEQ